MQDSLTHPEVVHDLDGLLVLDGNVHGDVVVEARANGELLWKGGPVVLPTCMSGKGQRSTTCIQSYHNSSHRQFY